MLDSLQYIRYLELCNRVEKSLIFINNRFVKAQPGAEVTPQDMQIIQTLRQHTQGDAADKNAVMQTANALYGKTDTSSIQKVLGAWQSFVSAKGAGAFASMGNGDSDSGKGPSPDAKDHEFSPHALNTTAKPAGNSPDMAGGSNSPGAALTSAAPAAGKDDEGEGAAPDAHYNASRESQDRKLAQQAGGGTAAPRITRDSTISDEASNISSEDTGNIGQSEDTHRKQGGQPTLVRGKQGGVYELTQNNNYRRISKKELAERQMMDTKHHTEEDPDSPSSPDPSARYGYVHHHETALHGLPALHPDNVEGGIKAMHPADVPNQEDGNDSETTDGTESDSSTDPEDTFDAHHIGNRDIPDGHMTGKKNLTFSDIYDQLKELSQFPTANGKMGHRLSWVSKGDSSKTSNGTKVSSSPTLNSIDFNIKTDNEGNIIVQPRILSFPMKGKGMSAQKQGEGLSSGDIHPETAGDATKKKDIYAPLKITKEMMAAGDLSKLNQMVAHLTDLAHLNRDKDVNKAMEDFSTKSGGKHEGHPKEQFSRFAMQKSSAMEYHWQRKLRFARMNKGYDVKLTGWNRFRKSRIAGYGEAGDMGQEEHEFNSNPMLQQPYRNNADTTGETAEEPSELDSPESIRTRNINSAIQPHGSGYVNMSVGDHEGDLSEHPEYAAHMQHFMDNNIGVNSVTHDRRNGIVQFGLEKPNGYPSGTMPATPLPKPTLANNIAATKKLVNPTLGSTVKSNKISSWNRFALQKAESSFDAWHDFVARTTGGVSAPTMRTMEGSEADNVPQSWSEQKVGKKRNAGVTVQTGAKRSDWSAKVKLAQGNDSINGGLPEQDKSIRDIQDPYEKSPLDMVIEALLSGNHSDAGFGPLIEQHDWQMETVPLNQLHGDNGTDYDEKKMNAMKWQMRRGNQLPPLIAIDHGDSYHIVDGKHRSRAMRVLNKYEANCLVGTPKGKSKRAM